MTSVPLFFLLPVQDTGRYLLIHSSHGNAIPRPDHTQQNQPVQIYTHSTIIQFEIIEHPKFLLADSTYHTDSVAGRPTPLLHQRMSRRGEPKMYETMLTRQRSYLSTNGMGNLYFYRMTHAAKGIGPIYSEVAQGDDSVEKYHFGMDANGQLINLPQRRVNHHPVALPLPAVIPQHVFRGFVEHAIANHETCPISFEPLTLEGVVAPPCCHLFLSSSIQTLLSSSSSSSVGSVGSAECATCPTCRQPFQETSLLRYSA